MLVLNRFKNGDLDLQKLFPPSPPKEEPPAQNQGKGRRTRNPGLVALNKLSVDQYTVKMGDQSPFAAHDPHRRKDYDPRRKHLNGEECPGEIVSLAPARSKDDPLYKKHHQPRSLEDRRLSGGEDTSSSISMLPTIRTKFSSISKRGASTFPPAISTAKRIRIRSRSFQVYPLL